METKVKILKTSKIVEAEIPKLQLPANPEDLINMYDLKDRIILQQSLTNNIEKYISDYHHSFLKTGEQVLQIIPEKQLKNYKIINEKSLIDLYETEPNKLNINDEFFYDAGLCTRRYHETDKIVERKTHYGKEKLYQRVNFYIINFKTKIIYKSDILNSFEFKQKDNILLIRKMIVGYSPFHRSYNPCILSKFGYIIIYDLKTNEAISSIKHNYHTGMSGHYDDSYFDSRYLNK